MTAHVNVDLHFLSQSPSILAIGKSGRETRKWAFCEHVVPQIFHEEACMHVPIHYLCIYGVEYGFQHSSHQFTFKSGRIHH